MINILEFRFILNKKLKKQTFDEIFDEADIEFLSDFDNFICSKIGQIWLKKINGKKYVEWQST